MRACTASSVNTGRRCICQGFAFALSLLAAVGTQANETAKRVAASVKRDAACTVCHAEMEAKPVLSIYQTRHGVKADANAPTCQDCHGESTAHLPEKLKVRPPSDLPYGVAAKSKVLEDSQAEKLNAPCLSCHPAGKRQSWNGSAHERHGMACVSCHVMHLPRDPVLVRTTQAEVCFKCHPTERAQIRRLSAHPLANGKMVCADCHNPHGSAGQKLLAHETLLDTCLSCHAEKRGPFLWEHVPATEDCTLCHTPHGSTQANLLKARNPWLCQQCHSSSGHPSRAYSSTTGTQTNITNSVNNYAQLALHGCVNCHSQIHGSNHPAGRSLVR